MYVWVCICVYPHVCICMYVCVYAYSERGREGDFCLLIHCKCWPILGLGYNEDWSQKLAGCCLWVTRTQALELSSAACPGRHQQEVGSKAGPDPRHSGLGWSDWISCRVMPAPTWISLDLVFFFSGPIYINIQHIYINIPCYLHTLSP